MYFDPGRDVRRSWSSIGACTRSGFIGVRVGEVRDGYVTTTVNTQLCQVRVTPRKSEGIEPFTMVNTPPCQVKASPSHPINTQSGYLEDASSPLFPTTG